MTEQFVWRGTRKSDDDCNITLVKYSVLYSFVYYRNNAVYVMYVWVVYISMMPLLEGWSGGWRGLQMLQNKRENLKSLHRWTFGCDQRPLMLIGQQACSLFFVCYLLIRNCSPPLPGDCRVWWGRIWWFLVIYTCGSFALWSQSAVTSGRRHGSVDTTQHCFSRACLQLQWTGWRL